MRGSVSLAALALALALSASSARAQNQPAAPPAPATAETPAEPRAAAEPPDPAPAARIPIVGYQIGGSRIDSEANLQALLQSVSALGDPFIETGPSDRIGKPFGTIPRLVQALDAFGYQAAITTRPGPSGAGVIVTATLLPYERLRYVFVSGNGRIRQDEIQRRITIRPGQALPPIGNERDAVLERERELVIDFLRSRGYFEANVRLDARPGTVPGSLDLYVTVKLGPAYPLGPITFTGNHALSNDDLDPMFRHGDWITLWNTPVPFTSKQLREDIDAVTKRYRGLGYVGVRVTTDFNVQKSIDRAAKNVRIGIAINERKRIAVAFEGNASQSSSTLQDQLTMFDRGSYDDFEVGASADALQHYYQEQGNFFARVDWRRERLSANEERIVFFIDEGPELRVRGIDVRGDPCAAAGGFGRGGLGATLSILGDRARAATSPAGSSNRTSSACSSTTTRGGSSRRRPASTPPPRRPPWASSARPWPPPRRPRASPAPSTSGSPSTRGRG